MLRFKCDQYSFEAEDGTDERQEALRDAGPELHRGQLRLCSALRQTTDESASFGGDKNVKSRQEDGKRTRDKVRFMGYVKTQVLTVRQNARLAGDPGDEAAPEAGQIPVADRREALLKDDFQQPRAELERVARGDWRGKRHHTGTNNRYRHRHKNKKFEKKKKDKGSLFAMSVPDPAG